MLKTSKMLRKRSELKHPTEINGDVVEIPEIVQEFYSIRCIPQVLGPVVDTLARTKSTVETEMNSVSDNPIVDLKNMQFLHGGNFHGDYVATALDQLKIAMVKLTMLSERRTNFFLNRNINHFFPHFMNLKSPGLTLGLQGLQFVATSTTAQSQSLAFPHNIHSIPTNGDNQDIVSMGTDAALFLAKVLENAYVVLAIELITLGQGTAFLKAKDTLSTSSRELHRKLRSVFPVVKADRETTSELSTVVPMLKEL
jgi:histidine ammonia-lyase